MTERLMTALPAIADRMARAERVLFCLNFYGTLAPFDDRPAAVRMALHVRADVAALARQERATVAIISGRACAELSEIVDVREAIFVGNHGLEICGPGLMFIEPTAGQFREPMNEIFEDFRKRLGDIPGAIVENKGITLSLHFRMVPPERRDEFRKIVHSALANAHHPFLLREGHMALEIRPRAYWDKGHAVAWLREQLPEKDVLIIYIGDDSTDEDAFAALGDGVSVKVGDPVGTAAQYFVEGPKEVHEFVRWSLEQVSHSPIPAPPGPAEGEETVHA